MFTSLIFISASATASPLGSANITQCDFESRSICGFTQAHGVDKFDWSYDNGGTSSSGTGPKVDHTLGTSFGWFFVLQLNKIIMKNIIYRHGISFFF